MRYREFLLEYSREKTLANDGLMTKVMAAVKRKDPSTIGRIDRGIDVQFDDPDNREYVLDKFERIDPTPNKQYMQPIMNMYVKDKFRGFEDQNRLKDALTLFARFKQRLDKRDINQYASLHELEDAVDPHAQELTKKEKRQQGEYHIDPDSYDVVAEDKEYVIVIPKDKKAACAFGSGTRWCTASTQGDASYFAQYNKEGHIYIIRTKDPNYDKDSIIATSNPVMQWHFESGQFMDVQDRPIKLELVPKELYELFRERFIDQLYHWGVHFFRERSRAYDSQDFETQFPFWQTLELMSKHDKDGLTEGIEKLLDGFHFDEFYKTFETYKDFTMFTFVREVTKQFLEELKTINPDTNEWPNKKGLKGAYGYLQMSNSDKHTWWKNLEAKMKQGSLGKLMRLMKHSKYDYDLGTDAKDNDVSLEDRDAWYQRQKFVAKEMAFFDKVLTHVPDLIKAKYPLFKDPFNLLQGGPVSAPSHFRYEVLRTTDFLGGDGLKGWMDSYILPKVLEKDGLSEEEIKSWMEDGAPPGGPYSKDEGGHGYQAGGLRYLDPRVRNDTLATNTEFGHAVMGLI